MNSVLHWTPLFWALRIAILVVVLDGLGLFALVTARFFRWKHMRRLVLADLPEVRRLGGQVAGAGATVELAEAHDVQFGQLERQVEELRRKLDLLIAGLSDEERNVDG